MPEATPPPGSLLAPERLIGGRYRLVRRLARGGMAEVWEAMDEVLARPVAAKVLLPHLAADEAFVTRFRREAVAAARLSHPHIVAIYDTCSDCEVEAIVMELVPGSTLRAVLDENGALPPARAALIAAQVADALDAAHRNSLVHRDVKPGNILLTDDGRVLVTDFGIAKATEASSDLTEVGQVVGTAKYLSPEQVDGRPLDARSDVYALGVVLYEMVCGRVPFSGESSTATALARLTTDPPRPRDLRPGMPPALEAVVLTAMARDLDDRYRSAAELRDALAAADLRTTDPGTVDHTASIHPVDATASLATWSDDPTPVPGPVPRPAPPGPPSAPARTVAARRRRWVAPTVLLVVVAATMALVGALLGRTDWGQDLLGREPGEADPLPGGSTGSLPPEESATLSVAGASSFDPFGDNQVEHEDEVTNLLDGNPATTWSTEEYQGGFPGRKAGVGIVFTLDEPATVDELQVATEATGWSGAVYVADQAPTAFEGWGEPVAEGSNLPGGQVFRLRDGAEGRAVLLWLTSAGGAEELTLTDARLLG